ncbi:hypothetical protein DACRYDRAFT_14994 [Dacryopinax primogenitus]|uniref:Uncharacterized protein n=1 Tax=Dacryopinax primogenitus (strain DJM 731) TaxID=1858805 RepID=M5GAR6_DACPD|nr:uncharacterized protein DACRYDRAFT_14994 [Dacryopinax primogenitus]EJU03062.1 hypothetical protein DACRYDRAFT_14994 [Dacryopinax primogenitus]
MATSGHDTGPNVQRVESSRFMLMENKTNQEKIVQKRKSSCARLETEFKKAQDACIAEEKKLSDICGRLASTEDELKAAQLLDAISHMLLQRTLSLNAERAMLNNSTSTHDQTKRGVSEQDSEDNAGDESPATEDIELESIGDEAEKSEENEDATPSEEVPNTPPSSQARKRTHSTGGAGQKTPQKRVRPSRSQCAKKKVRFFSPLVTFDERIEDLRDDQDDGSTAST